MGIYNLQILPRLINLTCGVAAVCAQRQAIVPRARGRVLEVGFGSDLNLPYYNLAQVQAVVGVDPVPLMRRLAAPLVATSDISVELLTGSAEEMPLEDASFDTVLVT